MIELIQKKRTAFASLNLTILVFKLS